MAEPSRLRALAILAGGLAVLALGIVAWLLIGQQLRGGGPSGSGTADIGGPFELVDQHGETRHAEDFRGRYMLVYFGYTYCPDVCPSTLLVMTEALVRLEAKDPQLAEQVVPLFVTIDPERDDVAQLASYAEHFHSRLVALTGSAEQIAAAAKAYRVFYRKAESEAASDYLMDHSSFVFLMGPDGKYVGHFGHDAKAEQMAAKIEDYLES